MKWVAISGSWRKTSPEIEQKVREEVRRIIVRGDGIVSGGALNVDYFATDEAMKKNLDCQQIKIFLPSTLEIYTSHYLNRADEGVITYQQAEELITQLTNLKMINPTAIIEGKHEIINQSAYFDRITQIIDHADELLAFQVNQSAGVQDTIDKAKNKGIPVKLFRYTIE